MGMIATVNCNGQGQPPCIVKWTGKGGIISISIETYCEGRHEASDYGVMQIPDVAVDAGACCPKCTYVLKAYTMSFVNRGGGG